MDKLRFGSCGDEIFRADHCLRSNVQRLKVAWQWQSADNTLSGYETGSYEATPIMVDGMLITSTSLSQIAAQSGVRQNEMDL